MKIGKTGNIDVPKPKVHHNNTKTDPGKKDYKNLIRDEMSKLDKSGTVAPPSRGKIEKLAGMLDSASPISVEDKDRMLLFEKILSVIKSLPETNLVREAKVEKIKKLIQSGKYHVPADKVAESIMRRGSF